MGQCCGINRKCNILLHKNIHGKCVKCANIFSYCDKCKTPKIKKCCGFTYLLSNYTKCEDRQHQFFDVTCKNVNII